MWRIALNNQHLRLRNTLGVQMKSFLTVWQRVDPVLIQPHGDGVHLSLSCRLLQLSPLLSQSALHHGRLRQRAIWILHGGKHKCVSVHTTTLFIRRTKIITFSFRNNRYTQRFNAICIFHLARCVATCSKKWIKFTAPWQSWQDSCPCFV